MQELIDFIARSRSGSDRNALMQKYHDLIVLNDEHTVSGELNNKHRRAILSFIMSEVRDIGDGSEKGIDKP